MLVGLGLGVLASDLLRRETRRLIRKHKLSKPAAKLAARRALKEANVHARRLERSAKRLERTYSRQVLLLTRKATAEALTRIEKHVKAAKRR
jgi:hypothetical protein